jgi:hypothetical protein
MKGGWGGGSMQHLARHWTCKSKIELQKGSLFFRVDSAPGCPSQPLPVLMT